MYIQKVNYGIDELCKSNDSIYDLVGQIDLKKLQENEIICYGISLNKSFIEIYYNNGEYSLRISNRNKEYFEDINSNDVKKYFQQKLIFEFGNLA